MTYYIGETVYVLSPEEIRFCGEYLPKKAEQLTQYIEDGMEEYFGVKSYTTNFRLIPEQPEQYKIRADDGRFWWPAPLLRLQ